MHRKREKDTQEGDLNKGEVKRNDGQKTYSKLQNSKSASHTAEDKPANINFRRIIFRCLSILAIVFFLSYMQKNDVEVFASEKENIEGRYSAVQCSKEYAREISQFRGCVPSQCGRFVTDTVISREEAQILQMIAEKGLSLGGSDGGASILDLHSGALSKGPSFINIYKVDKHHKIITNEDLKFYKRVKDKIKSAIVSQFGLDDKLLYLTHPTFFSRITAAPAKTIHDEYWHPHIDKETYPSFHFTSLLYLTQFSRDFEGGRFIFIDAGVNRTVEPKVGRLSAFTSGAENLHHVEKVSKGTRYAITVSFTCDSRQAISDPLFEST